MMIAAAGPSITRGDTMQINRLKHSDPIAEIHIRIHPPSGWADDNRIADAMWWEIESLTRRIRQTILEFDSAASAHIYQD